MAKQIKNEVILQEFKNMREQGRTNKEISSKIGISIHTAKKWVQDLKRKGIISSETVYRANAHVKKERNKLIVELIDKKKTYEEVRKQLNLKSRGTVHDIYQREKFGVRRWVKAEKELSTR